SQGEILCCLLQCVSKLPSLPCTLEEMVLKRLIRALTKQPPDMPHLPPVLFLQLRSIVQEIRAQGVMSRAQRKATDTAKHVQQNTEKSEEKSS
ncbi:hypothetical protein AB205_0047790, partial [Aquarana catesbeiana]